MNPLLDPEKEKEFDRMLQELDKAGFKWDGGLMIAPDGHRFYKHIETPFYRQVYYGYDYYQYWILGKR